MKVFIAPIWAILALLLCFNSNAQDIIYTISGEINNQKTPIDSIAIENLTKQTPMGFGNLPERDDYRINLTRDEYWGSTSVSNILNESGLQIIKNLPGTLVVGYRGQNTANANISLHNNNGQRLAFKENQVLENGSLVEVEIGNAGIYFLNISIPEETRSFKATGKLGAGNMNIATQSGAPIPLKSGQVYTLAGTGTEKGDNVKVSVFKVGYVALPVELTVDGNETLVFPLEAQTPPEVQTLEATNILSNSATLNGNLVSEGNSPISERGFYWSATNENPGEAYSIIIVEGTTGSFSAELSGLEHATTYYVRAYAINEIGTSYGEAKIFTTNAILPSITTTAVTNITRTTASCGGNVTSDGGAVVTARGVCWNTTGNPTIADSKTIDVTETGNWASELLELNSNTTYYVRAYATNIEGTAYGEQVSFKTPEAFCDALDNCNLIFTHSGNADWVAQTAVSYYGGSSAKSGKISHSQQSTLETTVNGPGIVSFYWKVSSESEYDRLTFEIGYYLRGNISGNVDWQLKEYEIPEGNHTLKWRYAKDNSGSGGQDCGWLDKIVFTPVELTLPTVATTNISNISNTTATSGGDVTSSGNATITVRGVCWNTTGNPTLADNKTSNGTGAGTFASSITGLTANTTYYVRAYATSSQGTAYGNLLQFTTSVLPTFNWPLDTQTEVVDVTNLATGKTWMDRNLGASRAATSPTDTQAYGDLYQWGRAADGHEKRNSPTTSTHSNSDTPGHGSFILAPNSPYDWRSPQYTDLWQGVNGTSNPCPSGYRLPTDAELDAECQSWNSNNAEGAFASPLKLPVAGYRGCYTGRFFDVGSSGGYWSSTVDGNRSRYLAFFSSYTRSYDGIRANGYSVRCIKD